MWQLQIAVFLLFVGFFIFSCAYLVTRLYFVFCDIKRKRTSVKWNPKRRKSAIKTLIIAGSGGHTTEILRLVETLDDAYAPREYIIANTDKMSEDKLVTLEKQRGGGSDSQYCITKVPRSREVKQSWISSFFTTIYASFCSISIVFKSRPDLILCNGPGTCVPICLVGFLLTILGLRKVNIIYVESICRVNTMSLSGKILYYFADHLLVQWPELQEKYPLTRYIGRLV